MNFFTPLLQWPLPLQLLTSLQEYRRRIHTVLVCTQQAAWTIKAKNLNTTTGNVVSAVTR